MRKLLATILAASFLIVGFSITSEAASKNCAAGCKTYAGSTMSKRYQACMAKCGSK